MAQRRRDASRKSNWRAAGECVEFQAIGPAVRRGLPLDEFTRDEFRLKFGVEF